MEKKHAYLIMAYHQPEQLKKLLHLLDDERNDLFIHIDAESDFPMSSLEHAVQSAGLFVIDRIPVRWAEYSQVEAELRLMEAAAAKGTYWYYHLLSGSDLPLKSQDDIHDFFREERREFIGTCPGEGKYQLDHVRFSYPLLKLKVFRKSLCLKALNEGLVLVQRLCGVRRSRKFEEQGWKFYDGWTWFSITDDFLRYVLGKEALISEIFKKAKAPDEMFLQTVLMNSPFRDRLPTNRDMGAGSMRQIDWKRGTPYVYRASDFEELTQSPYLFARKFDETVDGEIIRKLCSYIERNRVKQDD